jgi:hypothetical protein
MAKCEEYAAKSSHVRMERRNGILQMTLHRDSDDRRSQRPGFIHAELAILCGIVWAAEHAECSRTRSAGYTPPDYSLRLRGPSPAA